MKDLLSLDNKFLIKLPVKVVDKVYYLQNTMLKKNQRKILLFQNIFTRSKSFVSHFWVIISVAYVKILKNFVKKHKLGIQGN